MSSKIFGITIDEAEARQACQRVERKRGMTPKQLLDEVEAKQPPASLLDEAIRESRLGLVRLLVQQGLVKCPHCGCGELVWACCGEKL